MRYVRQAFISAACAAAVGAAGIFAQPAFAADPYLVGLTGDLSGPASGTYKPLSEGVRIYIDSVNAKGGINGHPIKLVTRDSRSDPNQVVADLNYLDSAGVVAVVFASPSGTIGAYTQQMAKIGMPTVYTNACYPPSTPPSPAKDFFCPGANTLTESYVAVDLLFDVYKSKEPMKLALLTTDIPGARGAAEKIMKPYAEKKGAQVIDVAVMPLGSTDATPIARSFQERGVNAVLTYTISKHMLAGADALAKIGWKGEYMMMTSLPDTLAPMRDQLKAKNIYGFDQFSLLSEGKPVHKKIEAAAKKYNFGFDPVDARWGWRNGMVLGAALKACGWPCNREKLTKVMNNLKVDSKDMIDLQGSPVVWTKSVHTSPKKAYRVYHYDPAKKGMAVAIDWKTFKERDWGPKK